MKNLPLNSLKNKFLSPQAQEIQKLAFYARFLVLSDFDDGWKYQMQKQLLDYLASLDFSEDEQIDLQVKEEIEENKGEIYAVLKAQTMTDKTAEKIIELSTILQQKYRMTPVFQEVGYIDQNPEDLKIVLEDLEQEEKGYERQQLQKLYTKILQIESEINDFQYQLNIYKDLDDNVTKALKIQLEQNIKLLESELLEKNKEMEGLLVVLYQKLAIKKDRSSTKTISKFQAEAVVDFAEQGKDEKNGILDLFKQFEEIYKENLEKNEAQISSLRTLFQEKTSEIEDMFNKNLAKTDTFYKQVEQLLVSEGKEVVNIKTGILTNAEIDSEGYLQKARILGVKNSEVYYFNGKLSGFEIDGIDESINNIEILKKIEDNIFVFKAEIGENTKILCYAENEQYKILEIEGESEFTDIEIGYSENNIPIRGKVLENGSQKYFYLQDGKYKFLEIEGEREFINIEIKEFENKIPIRGKVELENGSQKYFYLEDGKYKFLEIEGEKEFKDITIKESENNIPIRGILILENGKWKYFYLENSNYKILEIEGEKEFRNIDVRDYNSNNTPIRGEVKLENGNEKYFYLENGDYRILEIEGKKEFYSIYISETTDKNIPKRGEVRFGTYQNSYFYLENGEYKYLEIEGKKIFREINKLNLGEDNMVISGKLELSLNKYSYFYLENGRYKFLEIDGEKEFDYFYDRSYSEDNILEYGRIESENGNTKYFYLKNGKYEVLEIDGEREFKEFEDLEFDNGFIKSGKVRTENGNFNFFRNEDGTYSFEKNFLGVRKKIKNK